MKILKTITINKLVFCVFCIIVLILLFVMIRRFSLPSIMSINSLDELVIRYEDKDISYSITSQLSSAYKDEVVVDLSHEEMQDILPGVLSLFEDCNVSGSMRYSESDTQCEYYICYEFSMGTIHTTIAPGTFQYAAGMTGKHYEYQGVKMLVHASKGGSLYVSFPSNECSYLIFGSRNVETQVKELIDYYINNPI